MIKKDELSGIYILPVLFPCGKTAFFAGGQRMLDRLAKYGPDALTVEVVVGIYEPCKFAQSICLN